MLPSKRMSRVSPACQYSNENSAVAHRSSPTLFQSDGFDLSRDDWMAGGGRLLVPGGSYDA